jgi:hypothetical protein
MTLHKHGPQRRGRRAEIGGSRVIVSSSDWKSKTLPLMNTDNTDQERMLRFLGIE